LIDGAGETALEATLSQATGLPTAATLGLLSAANRLLGGVTAYPAAWIERAVQEVRDGTQARSVVSQEIAKAAGKFAAADPEIVERTARAFLPGAIRKQLIRKLCSRRRLRR
jgi:hypothetical protein